MPKHSNTIYQRTKSFLKKSKNAHNDKYDYSLVKYVDCRTKVTIICPFHGKFDQLPHSHVSGNGCKKCQVENNTSTTEEFISRSEVVHGNTYDYSQTNYVNAHTKVCIICPIHGKFYQRADDHTKGYGCSKPPCRTNKYTTKNFISDASKKHNNKYDYSKVEYTNRKTEVSIICPEHGEFLQKPNIHLAGHGCPKHRGKIAHNDTTSFIKMATKKHNSKYDYAKTIYTKADMKVKIKCPNHGTFTQLPYAHLSGQGCPQCVKNNPSNTKRFIQQATQKHTKTHKRI